jgi:zinc transporter ZupT
MTTETKQAPGIDLKAVALFLLPVLALVAVIIVFLGTGAGTGLESAPPVESLITERYSLKRGVIELEIRNTGPQALTISQVIINEAVWPFEASPSATIPRLGTAEIRLDYMWSRGEAYAIRLLSANAIGFDVVIPVAVATPAPTPATFLGFTLIGLYVGVIPVFLGIMWFPALRRMGRRTLTFLMAATVGLLVFLGVDTLFEAREASLLLPDAFQGVGLIAIGLVTTVLLLEAISRRKRNASGTETSQRMAIASIIAVGIGFHNLGEGLAIGAAYNIGELALGKFLVVGFIIQNITEGLGVVSPILKERPGLRTFAILGLIAGAPAILGAWIGGYAPSPLLAVLFLAIGAGAIFQVIYEIWRLLQKDTVAQDGPVLVYSGVVLGMLLLWVTGLLIK